MLPIFKNTDIFREHVGSYIQAFAEEHNLMSRPRRSLIGSYFDVKILLATPLIKWYLEHGLEVTRICQVIYPCFKLFGDAVSDARREGGRDVNKAIIADRMKLVRNSALIYFILFLSKSSSFANLNLAFSSFFFSFFVSLGWQLQLR